MSTESNSPSLEIFVINLKRSLDRKESIREYLKHRKISFRLLEAVDGAKLSAYENSRLTRKVKTSNILSRGELGCYLSHMEAYRIMRDEKIDIGVIIEDDYGFQRDIDIVQQIANVNDKWNIIHIFGSLKTTFRLQKTDRIKLGNGNFAARYFKAAFGTWFYTIKREYAEELLTVHRLPQLPIDTVLFDIRFCYRFPHMIKFAGDVENKSAEPGLYHTTIKNRGRLHQDDHIIENLSRIKSIRWFGKIFTFFYAVLRELFCLIILNVPWKDRKIKDLPAFDKGGFFHSIRIIIMSLDFGRLIKRIIPFKQEN